MCGERYSTAAHIAPMTATGANAGTSTVTNAKVSAAVIAGLWSFGGLRMLQEALLCANVRDFMCKTTPLPSQRPSVLLNR